MLPKPRSPTSSLGRVATATYPETPKGEALDTFHGTVVRDPYRWLEALDDSSVEAWIAAQNDLATSLLEGLADQDKVRARLVELWQYERVSIPVQVGSRTFQLRCV